MPGPDDEAAIREVEAAYDRAWCDGDVDRLMACLSEEAVVVNPRGEVASGMDAIRLALGGFLAGEAKDSLHASSVDRISFVGSDLAVVDGRVVLSFAERAALPMEHHFTDILVRDGPGWKIVHVRAYIFDAARESATTRLSQVIHAPRAAVYRALLDAEAVQQWMVPDDMTSEVHSFEPREGGAFRISLTYADGTRTGKSEARTDTYHGRFVKLVPDAEVVQVVEFETEDPSMQGEMRITYRLADAGAGTELVALHEDLPSGLSPEDNELGWRSSIGKLAALVENEAG